MSSKTIVKECKPRMVKAECDFCGSFTLCATFKNTKSTICGHCANPKRKFQEIIEK